MYVYRREDPATPSLCTLITLGWPPYVSSGEVEDVFSRVGCVAASYLQHNVGPVAGKVSINVAEVRGLSIICDIMYRMQCFMKEEEW